LVFLDFLREKVSAVGCDSGRRLGEKGGGCVGGICTGVPEKRYGGLLRRRGELRNGTFVMEGE